MRGIYITKTVLLLAAVLVLSGVQPLIVKAEEIVFPLWSGQTFFEEEPVLAIARSWREEILPVRYDAREMGKVPVIKSQGTLGTCWALTAKIGRAHV